MKLDQENKSLLILCTMFVLLIALMTVAVPFVSTPTPGTDLPRTFGYSRDVEVRPGQVWMLANDALNPDRDRDDSLIALFLVTDTTQHYIQYQREDGSVGSEPARRFRQNKVCITPPRNQSKKSPVP